MFHLGIATKPLKNIDSNSKTNQHKFKNFNHEKTFVIKLSETVFKGFENTMAQKHDFIIINTTFQLTLSKHLIKCK